MPEGPNQHQESNEKEWWTLRVDGASRSSGSRVGLLLQSPAGEHLEQAIRLGFPASNNEAEYEAILSGLDLALALSVSKLRVYSDSQLVKPLLATPLRQAKQTAKNGTNSITEYLRTDTFPEDPKQAHKVRVQAARFTIIGGYLYKRSFTGPYLQCLSHSEAQYVLAELHEGICGNHSEGRSLAHKAHSQGYYWPTMKKDAAAYVKKMVINVQRYASYSTYAIRNIKANIRPMALRAMGHGHSGPSSAPAQKKFLLVATDYFCKWVEAEAYASIKDKDVTKFVWKNIVCRFGIPQTIIADNGPQFDSITFRNFVRS
ncbi:hypothetical protein CK203_109381 [Vitis vinifera]|uniref:Integrase catalytic domain-containing protein n=1 Tax=Vitis vinifera TaxID=29760 RepID=A0A438BVF6_VITVI|nr:hypothetical protein CK203_109381 [Vitis vinifera]